MTDDEEIPIPYDLGPLPPPQEQDAQWAWRLWNALQIADEEHDISGGIWDMPGVGRYRRTGLNELTLKEIHASMDTDHLGVSSWNKQDWIAALAQGIGWSVIGDQVELVDQEVLASDVDEPGLEHIGKAYACPCGMVYSLRGPNTNALRIKVPEQGNCLNPNCDILIPLPHAGVLNVVDDGAVVAALEAQELIKIGLDEGEDMISPDDYPSPPEEAPTEGQGAIFDEEE